MHDITTTDAPPVRAGRGDEVAILLPGIDNFLAALAAWRLGNALRAAATGPRPSCESGPKPCARGLEPATPRTKSNGKYCS